MNTINVWHIWTRSLSPWAFDQCNTQQIFRALQVRVRMTSTGPPLFIAHSPDHNYASKQVGRVQQDHSICPLRFRLKFQGPPCHCPQRVRAFEISRYQISHAAPYKGHVDDSGIAASFSKVSKRTCRAAWTRQQQPVVRGSRPPSALLDQAKWRDRD